MFQDFVLDALCIPRGLYSMLHVVQGMCAGYHVCSRRSVLDALCTPGSLCWVLHLFQEVCVGCFMCSRSSVVSVSSMGGRKVAVYRNQRTSVGTPHELLTVTNTAGCRRGGWWKANEVVAGESFWVAVSCWKGQRGGTLFALSTFSALTDQSVNPAKLPVLRGFLLCLLSQVNQQNKQLYNA